MYFHIGTFGCGVLFCLILLHIGTLRHIEVLKNNTFGVASCNKDRLGIGANESSANESSVVLAGPKFSVKDHVENSTFGV